MASTIDFRNLDEGLGGAKRKRKRAEEEKAREMEEVMETEEEAQHASKRVAVAGDGENKPVCGRPTFDVIAGKVSGRKWKTSKTTRTSAMKVVGRKTSLEERNRDKEVKRAYKERMEELKETIRAHKVEKRKKTEERVRIKKENELRGQAVQKVTNPKTIKKMSKKQRKLLRPAPN